MNKRTTQFIPNELERKILALAALNGFSVTPSMGKSPNRHEIELKKWLGSKSEKLYISRSVGISKSQLQVVISSKAFKNNDATLREIEGVLPSTNQINKTQILQSSNYHGFENKGTLGRSEHWGFGYRLPSNDGLLSLESFLESLKPG